MKERLDYLRNVKRREVADYIHEAKEAGDISESSAYEDAKAEQSKLEGEIIELEQRLAPIRNYDTGYAYRSRWATYSAYWYGNGIRD